MSTKSPRSDKQYVWESVADSSSYVIREETNPEKLLHRGTQITLYLRVMAVSSFSSVSFPCFCFLVVYFVKKERRLRLGAGGRKGVISAVCCFS